MAFLYAIAPLLFIYCVAIILHEKSKPKQRTYRRRTSTRQPRRPARRAPKPLPRRRRL